MLLPPAFFRILLLVAIFAGLLLTGPGRFALAEEPPTISDRVTDLAGVADEAAIEDALDRFESEDDFQLFLVYVQTTQPSTIAAFVDETVERNNLSGRDSLLVVAARDRTYQLWLGDALAETVSEGEQDEVLNRVEGELRAGDFTGAALTAADSLRSAAGGSLGGGNGGGGGISGLLPLLLIAIVIGAGFWFIFGRKRGGRKSEEGREPAPAELATRANQLLIETDDALLAAYQEVEFARAQFGDEGARTPRAALDEAAAKLKAAFARRQELERLGGEEGLADAWGEVLSLAEGAKSIIDQQMSALNALRDMERSAPEVLERLKAQLPSLAGRLEEVRPIHAGLSRFAEGVAKPVAANPRAAEENLGTARNALAAAQAELDAGRTGRAVGPLRQAEEALARAAQMLDSVYRLDEHLQDAERRWQQELSGAQADLNSARRAAVDGRFAQVQEKLVEAEALIDTARRLGSASRPDPLGALEAAEQAEVLAESVLAEVEERQEEQRRLFDIARSTLRTAESSFARAEDYVMSRAAGIQARSRLREAERRIELARSLIDADPQRAIEEAQQATREAEEAIDQVSYGRRRGNGGVFGPFGGGFGGMGGLGGIIIGGLGGLGRRGGGWGIPGGRTRGGGWGGRSGGGTFGSGGRSRGGRW